MARLTGSLNHRTLTSIEYLQDLADQYGIHPADFLFQVMRGKVKVPGKGARFMPSWEQQLDAAKHLLPYMAPKQATMHIKAVSSDLDLNITLDMFGTLEADENIVKLIE